MKVIKVIVFIFFALVLCALAIKPKQNKDISCHDEIIKTLEAYNKKADSVINIERNKLENLITEK